MGSTWGLALPLLLFCGDAGGFRSSAGPKYKSHSTGSSNLSSPNIGPRTHGPVPLVTTNTTEVPAMPEGIKTRSEKTMDLQEPFMSYVSLQTQTLSSPTISKTLSTANNRSEVKSKGNRTTSRSARLRETPTISPLGENWTLSKIIAPTTVAGMTAPNETLTSRASGSPTGRGTPHRNGTRRDPTKATFSSPCTFDSSEEAHWITIDTSTEVESLSSENSSSSGSSVSRRNSSQALAPGTSTQAKALAAYRITHAEFTNCSITKETAAIISETSDTGPRPTEGEVALSTSESPASLPHSSEAEPFIPNTTALAEASSSASASVSAVLGADEVSNPRGTSVTITGKPLEGTSMLSFKTSNHTEVPEALPVSTAAGSTGGKVPSFAGSSASVYSPSDPVTIKDSTPSEKLTTASAADSRGPPSSSVHPATASTSSLPSAHPHTTASSQTPSLTSEGTFWTAHLHESSVPSQVPFLTQTPSTTTIPNTIITAGSVSEADVRESHTISPTLGIAETPNISPVVETLAISPEAETQATETLHISSAVETAARTLFISPDTETLRTQTTSPITQLEETLTVSSTIEMRDIPTISPVTEPRDAPSTSPVAETKKTPAISAATQIIQTPTSFPVAETRTGFTNTMPPTITPPHPTRPGTHPFVSDTAATKNSSPSDWSSTTDSTTNGSFSTSQSLLLSTHPTTASGSPHPSDHLITATSSPETDTTFLKITASPVTPTRPPTSTSATLWSRQTMGVTADGDGGFLLVRLRVAYLEDLTEPSVVEKLMEQLHCELLAHKLLVQVSLLRVKRG